MIFGNIISGLNYQERPAAYAVIVDDDGKIAAVKTGSGYFLPGGGSLADESPDETVKRELREELAREIEIVEKICEATQYFSVGDEHYRMRAFFYKVVFSSQRQGDAEYDLHWLDEKDIAENFFHECHKWAVNLNSFQER